MNSLAEWEVAQQEARGLPPAQWISKLVHLSVTGRSSSDLQPSQINFVRTFAAIPQTIALSEIVRLGTELQPHQ